MPAAAESLSRTRRAVLALLAGAGLLATALVAVGPAAPAHAAACSGATGVTVVADFNSLGGGVQGSCAPGGGGRTASTLFPSVGLPLTYVQRQPGFVCRVSGKPASDRCVDTPPASAYWNLWWSDGCTGTWTYSSLGVGSLKVPDGGYVALSWDDGAGNATPSYPAPRRRSAQDCSGKGGSTGGGSGGGSGPTRDPEPTPEPTPADEPTTSAPSTSPSTSPSSPSASPSATPTASATPEPTNAPKRPRPTEAPTTPADPTTTAETTPAPLTEPTTPTSSEASPQDDGGLPGWLAPLVVVLLLAVAGVVALLRRRPTP